MSSRAVRASGIDWNKFDAVIFDVDGTLFDHVAMRPSMAAALIRHVLTHRHGWRDLFVVLVFRRVRTRLAIAAASDVGRRQFEETSKAMGVPVATVEKIIARWIYEEPLSVIKRYAFPAVDVFLATLKERGIRTGVFSDYPAEEKLRVLRLSVDVVRDATAIDVARLKPDPSGFLKVAELLGISPSRCLIIGDRDDRDGEAAKRGGFIYLKKTSGRRQAKQYHFKCYRDLVCELKDKPLVK
jgi:HAD superfamily hydrolase (TIGR01549 family)